MTCDPWRFWNQLNDQPWDGQPDENKGQNCGPECVAMVLWYCRGVELPADAIKDQMIGQGKTGNTTLQQLHDWLKWQNVDVELAPFDLDRIGYYVDWTSPVIVLQKGITQPWGFRHFLAVVGRDGDRLIVANPWGGKREAIAASAWASGEVYPTALYVNDTRLWGEAPE